MHPVWMVLRLAWYPAVCRAPHAGCPPWLKYLRGRQKRGEMGEICRSPQKKTKGRKRFCVRRLGGQPMWEPRKLFFALKICGRFSHAVRVSERNELFSSVLGYLRRPKYSRHLCHPKYLRTPQKKAGWMIDCVDGKQKGRGEFSRPPPWLKYLSVLAIWPVSPRSLSGFSGVGLPPLPTWIPSRC